MDFIETIIKKLQESANSEEFMKALVSDGLIVHPGKFPESIQLNVKERKVTKDEIINIFKVVSSPRHCEVHIQILGKNPAKTNECFWFHKPEK